MSKTALAAEVILTVAILWFVFLPCLRPGMNIVGNIEDGLLRDELEAWIDEVKGDFQGIFKSLKAEAASTVLHVVSAFVGDDAPGAFSRLRLIGGPKKTDKIAVIGAGPAGTHTAYLLKKAGYERIRILEKTDRIGGKSLSIDRNGVKHEMGTCYMSPDYIEVKQLLAELGYSHGEHEVLGRTVYDPDEEGRGEGVPFDEWLNDEIRRVLRKPKMTNLGVALRLLKDSVRYINHHRRLLGKYKHDGFLPGRPVDSAIRAELNCTFGDLLVRLKMKSLLPVFKLAMTTQGYGFIDRSPAVYGLMWVTPTLLIGLVEQLKVRKHLPDNRDDEAETDLGDQSITVLKGGFDWMWKAMVEQSSTEVTFNATLKSIQRTQQEVIIKYTTPDQKEEKTEEFDFIIITVPVHYLHGVLDTTPEENAITKMLHSSTFITTLFDYVEKNPGQRAIESWFRNVEPDRPLHVWTARDALKMYRENGQGHELPKPSEGSTQVGYQYADIEPEHVSDEMVDREFRSHFTKHKLEDVKVAERYKWPYFDRFHQWAINEGMPWKVLDMQGKKRTWYTGGWTSFEAINAIVSYNKRLVETWVEQEEKPNSG